LVQSLLLLVEKLAAVVVLVAVDMPEELAVVHMAADSHLHIADTGLDIRHTADIGLELGNHHTEVAAAAAAVDHKDFGTVE
jgi:urease accessory protein UreE